MDEEMGEDEENEFRSLIRKRAERIPLQYITGEQEFMGLNFHVNSGVLIPRQDTETLVEEALKRVAPGMHILDMCTGSGCVLISILKNAPEATGIGCDISKQAINVAKENARTNEVAAEFERSDLFDNVMDTFDMIVSNPPYIPSAVIPTLMPEVAEFEPAIALDGKEDGLYFYRRIIAESEDYLKPQGVLLFEIGHDQGAAVRKLMECAGFMDVEVVQDLAHNDRVVCGRRP
jgi:release factor glutamine methyltransferase